MNLTTRSKDEMTFNPISFFLTGFIAFFLVIAPAHAYFGKDKIPALKTDVGIPKEQFEARTDLVQETPLGNSDFAFHVRLPKGWIKVTSDIGSETEGADLFRQLAYYTSPPRMEQRSIFRVRTIDLLSLISVDDWFIGYMLQMGFSVEGMTVKSKREVHAQYTLFEDGEPYSTRAVVTVSGSKIVLAEYMVHQDVYLKEKDDQIWAMTGFGLDSPNQELPIVMKTFSFVDIAKFDYPSNWSVHSTGIINVNRMDAAIVNSITKRITAPTGGVKYEQQMAGRIDVSVVSRDLGLTLNDEVKILNEGLRQRHYKLGKFIETKTDFEVNPLISNVRVDVYQLESEVEKLAGYEYWVAVLQTQKRYYLVRLITLSRGENFQTWAQSAETYRVVLQSLGPASSQVAY